MHPPIDPAQVRAAARSLSAEQGLNAQTEALRRIIEANSKGDPQQAAFWQQVARALELKYSFYPNL
jgi:hypothetical protein